MQAQTITSVASAVLALASASMSAYFSQKSSRHAEQSDQHQYEDTIRSWAERTVDVTGHLVELLSEPGEESGFREKSRPLLAVLRSQIDKGRWYFPNILKEKKGMDKPLAFRGIRQPILDVLVDLFWAVKDADWNHRERVYQRVDDLHRQFVSHILARLDPSTRDANYQNYVALSAEFVDRSLQRAKGRPEVMHHGVPDSDPAVEAQ
jgi:hypothetical protein